MKSRKEHRVPLSSATLVVLERADGLQGRDRGLVFLVITAKMVGVAVFGRSLNDLSIDCSPRGFRSSFRSWCSDKGVDRELAEQALAHAVGSQVEQCYARSDVLERRREVMETWGRSGPSKRLARRTGFGRSCRPLTGSLVLFRGLLRDT